MSKEFEALERIKEWFPQWRLTNREDFNILKLALMNREILLKECDNTYQVLNKHHIITLSELDEHLCYVDIIKSKGCSFIEIALIISCKNYEEYCTEIDSGRVYSNVFERKSSLKTKEEFDLLKKVLCGL